MAEMVQWCADDILGGFRIIMHNKNLDVLDILPTTLDQIYLLPMLAGPFCSSLGW